MKQKKTKKIRSKFKQINKPSNKQTTKQPNKPTNHPTNQPNEHTKHTKQTTRQEKSRGGSYNKSHATPRYATLRHAKTSQATVHIEVHVQQNVFYVALRRLLCTLGRQSRPGREARVFHVRGCLGGVSGVSG